MAFNLLMMVWAMLVGYFQQSVWIFLGAIVWFLYRYFEAQYFKNTYGPFASMQWGSSKWTSFTTWSFLGWLCYVLYLTVDLLFLKG